MQIDPQVKNSVALAGLILISATVVAQPFSVGHKSVEFYDSDRDRNVATEAFLHRAIDGAESAGTDAVGEVIIEQQADIMRSAAHSAG